MEGFNVIYIKLPLLVAVFLGSPWIFYQIWSFISPGLYKREKRWAVPFILATAGLFITGGLFAYFVAFRYGLVFLLGIGLDVNVSPFVSIDTYFDLFVNVTLGVGLVFEMPVIIFFLTLLRVASPRFLLQPFALRHSRHHYHRRYRDAYARRVQHDAVHHSHDRAVLPGSVRQLSARLAPRRQKVPMAHRGLSCFRPCIDRCRRDRTADLPLPFSLDSKVAVLDQVADAGGRQGSQGLVIGPAGLDSGNESPARKLIPNGRLSK